MLCCAIVELFSFPNFRPINFEKTLNITYIVVHVPHTTDYGSLYTCHSQYHYVDSRNVTLAGLFTRSV